MRQAAAQIRSEFLKYFEINGHTVVESSSLIPQHDPTLLFTNAGMVPFKDVFLGKDPRSYQRATSSQKCVRAGGKHNDLENVGFTARHHTFFEMLGNFSFGDYFKKEAIHYAWHFVTKVLSLPKDRLYITVYTDDNEAESIWHTQEKIPKNKIYRFGEKDNFWSMGETGPCGPCSEIFFDRGSEFGCKKPQCAVGCECDRFMEIWNLVFMQFNRTSNGELIALPKPSIDTGMGLERITSVVQNVGSNYETDLFQSLISKIGSLAKINYGYSEKTDTSLRVIADHCRATNFLIGDGVLPSNEGRGYVLRRIMRRAIRHGRNLGFTEPFFYKITNSLIDLMGEAYPDLHDKKEFLESTIKLEEEKFLVTLENGLSILEDAIQKTSNKTISGEVAFKLYDTYGFPLDLTQVIAHEHHMSVDEPGFQKQMLAQKQRSRENWQGSGEESVQDVFKELHQLGLQTKFKGYDSLECSGKIIAIIEDGKLVQESSKPNLQLVLDQTPFYAESGGQVGDRGELTNNSGFNAQVTDVQKPFGNFIVLFCENVKGSVKINSIISQKTSATLRSLTAKNHTATHMLHAALRKFLGPHVKQAGSLVNSELLRFDFTHTKPLSQLEIEQIENFINASISLQEMVDSEEMDKEKALAKGAIAFFGDKYGSKVRVISVGEYSVELCGGTHVQNTAQIQGFKVLNESGIASGVRRITAITGPKIIELLRTYEKLLDKLAEQTKASAFDELIHKIEKLQSSEKELRKSIEAQSKKNFSSDIDQWIKNSKSLQDGKFISHIVELQPGENASKILRELTDLIRSKEPKAVVALATFDATKNQSFLVLSVTKDWLSKFQANDLLKQVVHLIDGSGGGKTDLAQAGGKKSNFLEVFSKLENILGVK